MVKHGSILIALVMAPTAFGGSWNVCVTDTSRLLTPPVRGAVTREFGSLMGGHGAGLAFDKCAKGGSRIHLVIKDEPPNGMEGVLGLARRKRDRIEPQLQVFYGSLVRYLGEPNNSEAVGRAVARVAAHEAAHFLEQQPHHCQRGLLQAMMSAYELLAADPAPFHFDPQCAPDASEGHATETLANAATP
ncbi:MAG: hypothetical protein F4X12_11985 [Acidobacteriia bacterium]|nr:hypothetical protein [Terriglobia bacterium]